MIVATVLVGLIAIIGILWYRHIETKHYDQIELRRLKHNEEMERIALEKKKRVDADMRKNEVHKILKEYDKQLEEINNQHETDIKKISHKHDFEMEKMRIDHQLQMQRLKENQKESITKVELEFESLNKKEQLTIEKKTELYEMIIDGGFKDLELERRQLDLRYTECIRAQQDVKAFPTSGWFFSRDEQKLQELKQHAVNICKEHSEAQNKLDQRLRILSDGNFKFQELAAKLIVCNSFFVFVFFFFFFEKIKSFFFKMYLI